MRQDAEKGTDMEEKQDSHMMQLFLEVKDDERPVLVARPVKEKPYPANLVLLPGCVVESVDDPDETETWEICGKVSGMCAEGQAAITQREEIRGYLETAHTVASDLATIMDNESQIGYETIRVLAEHIRHAVSSIGTCMGMELDGEDD